MSDYISREAAIAEIESWCKSFTYARPFHEVLTKIAKSIPAADVVEVVHGEWLYLYDGNYKCSSCGTWYSTDETPEEAGLSYCPTCGARMDGGADNG